MGEQFRLVGNGTLLFAKGGQGGGEFLRFVVREDFADFLGGELVATLVAWVAGVAAEPVPVHAVWGGELVEAPPEIGRASCRERVWIPV